MHGRNPHGRNGGESASCRNGGETIDNQPGGRLLKDVDEINAAGSFLTHNDPIWLSTQTFAE